MAVSAFFSRLKSGLSRSAARITGGITATFTKRKLDDAALEELEEQLIAADLGADVAARIIKNFRSTRFGKEVTDEEVRETLAAEIAKILGPVAQPAGAGCQPKTLCDPHGGRERRGQNHHHRQTRRHATARPGSPRCWPQATRSAPPPLSSCRSGARARRREVVTAPANTDAASLAHDALSRAQKTGADVLLIDTAGRLHNKTALMEELRKIIRVIRKLDPTAPHAVLLTLDATTGQNAVTQVGIFKEMVDLTGLIVTKLDGSARGGIVVALAEKFGLPIHAVGTGEQIADLRDFDAGEFARALVGTRR